MHSALSRPTQSPPPTVPRMEPPLPGEIQIVREVVSVVVQSMDGCSARNLDNPNPHVRSLASTGLQVAVIREHLTSADNSPPTRSYQQGPCWVGG